MRQYLLAGVGAYALLMGAASAADLRPMPVKAPPPVYAPLYYNWTGFYLGGHIGGGWVRSGYDGPFGNRSVGASGWLGGIHGGFNWQVNQFVFGLEGDWDWASIYGNNTGAGITVGFRSRWAASIRGRAGYAVDRMLFYFTGGWAMMDAQLRQVTFPAESRTASFNGYTIGGGIEYAFAPNWAGRLEYRYTDFNRLSVNFPLNVYTARVDPRFQSVTAGISYKF